MVIRSINQYDKSLQNFFDGFDIFYKTGDKSKIIHLVENILKPHGGRLFDGFSLGKK